MDISFLSEAFAGKGEFRSFRLPFDVRVGFAKPNVVNPHIFWPKDAAFEDIADLGRKELKEKVRFILKQGGKSICPK